MKNIYLGIDVGSVSTNVVALDEDLNVIDAIYIRTKGNPIKAVKNGMNEMKDLLDNKVSEYEVCGVGTTGSGRDLASVMLGADIVKNEITAHAVAALTFEPDVKTVLEIGGQDSKIIILKDKIVSDFAMNTVCAAGTGSFLDRQAERLEIPIEEFGDLALKSEIDVRIAGRCAVFAESDMIHKQQLGYEREDIINGLCKAMVRNYLNNVGKGKDIQSPIIFQGGVAANKGIKNAFEEELGCEVRVPKYHNVMGAVGSAVLAKEQVTRTKKTNFKGFDFVDSDIKVKGFECDSCSNVCEVVGIYRNDELVARWGDKCGKWSNIEVEQTA